MEPGPIGATGAGAPPGERVIVETGLGRLAGRRVGHPMAGGTRPDVHAFLGIRYAEPPLGPLRWQPPRPATAWTGTRDATAFGDDPAQVPNPMLRGPARSEDCLVLNVWTPARSLQSAGGRGAALPVMVWLHGGGFVGGSGSDLRSDGTALAAAGVVVVSVNYRTGLFGFLAHPGLSRESPDGVSGNYGLLDQIAALRWIRTHIGAFGGDADRITVFGVSAGSASIALLLTAPAAQGLFRQAILHSPGTCRPLADLATAEALGATLGDDIDTLRRLSTADVLSLTRRAVPAMRGLTTPRVLRPIRDGVVIPGDELPAFDAGRFAKVALIVGTNADEGSKLTANWTVDTTDAYQALLDGEFGSMAQAARQVYPATVDDEVRGRVAELFADTQFNYGAWRVATAMAAHRPVWRYLFRHRLPGRADGPHHGDEVAYVFGMLDSFARAGGSGGNAWTADDFAVSDAIRDAWVRFATTGAPDGAPDGTPDGAPDADPDADHAPDRGAGDGRRWPRFEPDAATARVFDAPGGFVDRWRQPQIDFVHAYSHRSH